MVSKQQLFFSVKCEYWPSTLQALFLLIFCDSGGSGSEMGSTDLSGSLDSQYKVVAYSGMVDATGPGTPACLFQRVRENDVVTLADNS